MPTMKGGSTKACPTCKGRRSNPFAPSQLCTTCGGAGQVSKYFDMGYYYPFNMTVLMPGLPAAFVPPTYTPQSTGTAAYPGNPNQTGVNPALLKLGNENPTEWIFNLIRCTSPFIIGDASDWLQLSLSDVSGTNWPFMNAPILAVLFAGDAKNPFPQLNPLTFGPQTQLQLAGYPILISGNSVAVGLGTGGASTYTFQFNGPVTPGSVVITDATDAIVGTDAASGNGIITGASIHGVINYTTGVGSVTLTATLNAAIIGTYSQGPAVVNLQFAIQGNYRRLLSDQEQQQRGA